LAAVARSIVVATVTDPKFPCSWLTAKTTKIKIHQPQLFMKIGQYRKSDRHGSDKYSIQFSQASLSLGQFSIVVEML
jgi:hypothetical protein